MARSVPLGDLDAVEELPLVSLEEKGHVQRVTTSCIVPVRALGTGAFGQVDLVSIPVSGERKLLVRKMLVPGSSRSSLDGTATQAAAPKAPPALKPSSLQDWNNEASMHRECAGCPFVLQLLAAKRCRSGNLLLLLEYAALGSLTDILTARRQQEQQSHSHLQRQPSGQAATSAAAAAVTAAAAAAGDSSSIMVDALMPLAMSAVELLERHAKEDDAKRAAKSASVVDLTQYCEQQQQGDEFGGPGADADEDSEDSPVFVTLMPELIAEAQQAAEQQWQRQQQAHLTAAAGSSDAPHVDAASISDLQDAAAQLCADGPPAEPCRVPHAGLPEEAARFFAGCVLMALQWMHSRRILHRDIKPCNLLLFGDGYLKLADMGCCCQLPPGIDAAQTRTGTAAYMAPEVASGAQPYSYPVDMWSLGITIWQMVDGHLPAWAEEQQQHGQGQEQQQGQGQQQQGQGKEQGHSGGQGAEAQGEQQQQQQQQYFEHPEPPEPLLYPAHFSKELCSLLSGLLHNDSAARMRIEDVMDADWFDGFDWQGLRDKTLAPPALEAIAPPALE